MKDEHAFKKLKVTSTLNLGRDGPLKDDQHIVDYRQHHTFMTELVKKVENKRKNQKPNRK